MQERMDPPLPRVQKRVTEKNVQPPHPLEDIVAIETEQVVCTCMGDIIQIFWDPNPIDQLVAALHNASLKTNPECRKPHGLDPDSDSDSDDESRPRVRIPPSIFKGLPGERPDMHLLATEDWMEAMQVKSDDYIDKFKHTL